MMMSTCFNVIIGQETVAFVAYDVTTVASYTACFYSFLLFLICFDTIVLTRDSTGMDEYRKKPRKILLFHTTSTSHHNNNSTLLPSIVSYSIQSTNISDPISSHHHDSFKCTTKDNISSADP